MRTRPREPFGFESDRLKYFVDREEQLTRAEEVLRSPAGTALPVLVFHGVGGMGKTLVLEKIRADLCGWRAEGRDREAELPHAWVDFSSAAAAEGGVRSRTGMLHHIKRELDGYGLQFPRFELVWARYREMGTGEMFQPSAASRDDFGTVLDLIEHAPEVGGIVGLFRRLGKLERFQRRAYRKLNLADGLEWQHPYEAAEAIPEALADDIAENVERLGKKCEYRSPVLFFDSLECLEGEGEEGLLALKATEELCEYLPEVPIIIGSRSEVEWAREEIGGREIEHVAVDVIPEGYREQYLRLRGVGERSWKAIVEVTGGHALWMGIAGDIALDVQDREGRPVTRADLLGPEGKREELLDRLLERLGEDRPMRETVRAACVCRWFDYRLLEAVRGETDHFEGQFGDLGGLSFVMPLERDENGRIVRGEIHQTVRELVVGGMRSEDLERLASRGADYCEGEEGDTWEAERVYFLMLAEAEEGLRYGEELFNRVNFEWNRALGEEVLEASRDGWRWRHIGEAERREEPWQFAAFEADMAKMEGNPSGALRTYQRALEGTRREGDRHGEGLVLNSMAIIHRQQGRYEEAMGLHEQSLEIMRELGDRRGEGKTLNNMAGVHQRQARYEEAMGLYGRSLEIKRELGDRQGEAVTLNNMAGVHQAQGRYEEAMGLYEQSLEIKRELGDRRGEGATLNNIGEVHRRQGRYEEAMALYEQSLAISRELGDRSGEGGTLNNMAIIHEQQGRYEEAMGLYEQSLEIMRELGDRRGEGVTLGNMANVRHAQGRHEQAMGVYEQALAIKREVGDRHGEGQTLTNMAISHEQQGRYAEAMGLYEQGLEIFRELGERLGEGQTLGNMGTLAEKTGQMGNARERLEEALEALEGLGVPEEEKVREWLERLGMGNGE